MEKILKKFYVTLIAMSAIFIVIVPLNKIIANAGNISILIFFPLLAPILMPLGILITFLIFIFLLFKKEWRQAMRAGIVILILTSSLILMFWIDGPALLL